MRRLLKYLGFGVLGLALIVGVAVAGVYVASGSRIGRTYSVPPARLAAADLRALDARAAGPAAVERGRHFVTAIGKCADCHAADLGGGLMADMPPGDRLYAANLTRGRGGVGARYTTADWVRTMRHGVSPTGRALLFMPSQEYRAMSDADLVDMLAYLRTLAPVDRVHPASSPGPLTRALFLAGDFPLLPAELIDHSAPPPPAPPTGMAVARGEYLATVGGCRGCHLPDLAGGGGPPPGAPNITPAGIGRWTEADFFRALREGKTPDGRTLAPSMPWRAAGQMTDDEIRAVWAYLRSVPAKQRS